MKTLNYIDPIISPSILLDRPNHHTRFENQGPGHSLKNNFDDVSGQRFIIKHANGSKITDTRGNEYIDFNLSQGASILGHAPSVVLQATEDALRDGLNHGMPTLAESLLAQSIQEAMPSVEKIKLVNSGAEAVKGVIRLARAFTGKERILVIEGTNASVACSNANASSILPFNNIEAVTETFSKHKDEIAAIFVEPVFTTNGVVLPDQEYIQFLRKITFETQSLLIFDETTTGFRPGLKGAQGYFGVTPDLTVLGKIIGGGFPIGAIVGKEVIISLQAYLNAEVPINSITAIAGISTLKRLSTPLFYETLNHRSRDFIHCLTEITKHKGIVINSFRSMFSFHFSENGDNKRFELFHKKLLKKGVYLSPSPFETNFISIAHLPEDLNRTLEAVYSI
jgi:glutamate-1-semialdehyde 2,1-aminomutase